MSDQTPKILLANQAFVPETLITKENLGRWRYEWTDRITEEKVDEFGELVVNRFGRPKLKTKLIERSLKTYEWIYTNGESDYVAIPRGDIKKLGPLLRANETIDVRSTTPLGIELEIGEHVLQDPRWPEQERCVKEVLRRRCGIVTGKTGAGKSIVGIGVIAGMEMKTLILSKRRDGNTHWIREIQKHTNIQQLEELYSKQLIGAFGSTRAKKRKPTWPITVATVQSFLSPAGHQQLIRLQNEFGLILIDEVHEFGSREFSRILSCFNPSALCGLTATVKREDKAHFLLFDLVGPVVAEAKSKQMPPIVTFVATRVSAPQWVYRKKFPRHYQWGVTLKYLANSDQRYDTIIKWLHQDIEDGRVIACISERRAIPKEIFVRLREQGYDVAYVDGNTRNRERIYNDVRNGTTQILCAGKVLNAMVNIPSLDCIHVLTPLNSKTAIEQIYGRGSRWLEGKRRPLVRYYADQGGQLTGAYKNNLKICQENEWEIQQVDTGNAIGMTRRISRRQ